MAYSLEMADDLKEPRCPETLFLVPTVYPEVLEEEEEENEDEKQEGKG